MLKLHDLFEDFDLAKEALELYGYDKEPTEEVIEYFRISANMIYPFVKDKELYFLRLAPNYEKNFEATLGEVKLLMFLKENGLSVPDILPAKDGKLVSKFDCSKGSFWVIAMKKVPGQPLEDFLEDEPTEELLYGYGKLLGKYHKVMSSAPTFDRPNQDKILFEIESNLKEYAKEPILLNKFDTLKRKLNSLPKTKENYGLVHYDMEPDNVFFSKKTGFSIIDFDDSFYSFYSLDYVRAYGEIANMEENFKAAFKRGYESEFTLDSKISLSLLKQFANFQHFAEIKRTLSDKVENKPDWMIELIDTLTNSAEKYKNEILLSEDL